MQVFELYIRRLLKRKAIIVSMILLPLLATYIIVQAVQPNDTKQLAHMFNSIIGLLLIFTCTNPMLFYGDKKYATDRRILLSTHSVIRFYSQLVAVFLSISAIQLICVGLLIRFATNVTIALTFPEYFIIILAYILLNAIAIGFCLIIACQSHSRQSSWLRLIIFTVTFVLLGGLMLPNEYLPIVFREIAIIIPSYWLTEVISFILEDSSKNILPLSIYLSSLLICALFIMMGLTRSKSRVYKG